MKISPLSFYPFSTSGNCTCYNKCTCNKRKNNSIKYLLEYEDSLKEFRRLQKEKLIKHNNE